MRRVCVIVLRGKTTGIWKQLPSEISTLLPRTKDTSVQHPKPCTSWILNQPSLVFRGSSLKSYYSLWFICRCTSPLWCAELRGFAPVGENKKCFENKRRICQTVKKTATDGRFVLPWYIVHVSFTKRLLRCFDTLRLVQQNNFFVKWNPCFSSCVYFGIMWLCIKSITYSFKIWLERVLLWRCSG